MVTNELKTKVNAKIEECRKVIMKHYGHDIKPGKISYTARGTVGGTTNPSTYEIRLNPVFLGHYKDEFVNDTVVHEYAHVATLKLHPDATPHGKEWKQIMRLLGVEPTRCHAYDNELIYEKRATRSYMCTCCYQTINVDREAHKKIMSGNYKPVHADCGEAPLIFVGP